jgi:Tol biopolymer transport system component
MNNNGLILNLLTISRLNLLFISALTLENATAHEILTRISVDSQGRGGNGASQAAALSANGRYLAFQSEANNLIENDTNGYTDIFIYDRITQICQRVSVSSQQEPANFVSFFPTISGDGQWIAFQSDAFNLVANDSNSTTDIFLHQRDSARTIMISINSKKEQGNSTSSEPSISADGRYIAFHSYASNLVANDTNQKSDIFVYERETGTLSRVSVRSKGEQVNGPSFGAAINGNGRFIAFSSDASDLVANDNNETIDVFVHDREALETVRVSVSSEGEAGNDASYYASISADGRLVAFQSRATNLVAEDSNGVEDIFVHDLTSGETQRVSVNDEGIAGEAASFAPQISGNGRFVIFNSNADNLVADDDNQGTDVFVYDLANKNIRRLTLNSQNDRNPRAALYAPSISYDGRWAAFESKAWNLVANDFNEAMDIFLYDRAYYATYDITKAQLYIPVLNVPGAGLFKAYLDLQIGTPPLKFNLGKSRSFPIDLIADDIPTRYDAGFLELPRIEVFQPPQASEYCQATMKLDEQNGNFILTQLICSPD